MNSVSNHINRGRSVLVPPVMAAILAVAAAVAPAAAQDSRPVAAAPAPLPPPDPRQSVTLVTENDAYVSRQDRWYTNGLRLNWSSAEDVLPGPLAWLDAGLAGLFGPARSRWGLAIGQLMFTPVDLTLVDPDPRDRPYAGYLYGMVTLDRRTDHRLDRVALQVGVMGPASLAEQAQRFVHRIFDKGAPLGWGYQLGNQPMFNLYAERIWRVKLGKLAGGPLELDLLPAVNLAGGTVQVSAGAGGRLRLGQGLDRDFGPARIRPALGDGPAPVGEGFGWYAFIGAYGRAVAHDIFLDGDIGRSSRSVPRQPLVGDLEAGLAAFHDGFRLSFSYVLRSREFEGQSALHQLGSIALTYAF